MTRPAWSQPAHHLSSSGASWRWPSVLSRVLGVCLLMWACCPPAAAQSSGSLAGTWQAEPMTVRWVIGDWGAACGPRPAGGGDSGGAVTIEERGTELVISGGGRGYSTEQCWEMHPGLVRQSHSGGRREWKTTCRTPPNDSRQEILQTTVTATDDVISFQESGQYQFAVQGQTCSASSGRWRTYRRGGAAAQPAPPAAVPPAELAPRPPVENRCKAPGAPARIEVRPSRKLMRAGESFQFRATVLDGRGCVARAPVSWELLPPDSSAKLDAGQLSINEGAPDAELVVVATAASQSVRVNVDVVSNERYATLLASGGFDAEGASAEAATAIITSGSLGAQQVAEEPERSGRKWTFVGLVSVIAALFAAMGVWLVRRANRNSARERGRGNTSGDGGTVVFEAEDAVGDAPRGKLPDATRLEPFAAAPPAPQAATVCPVCGTLYDAKDLKACPKDGARLLPINA